MCMEGDLAALTLRSRRAQPDRHTRSATASARRSARGGQRAALCRLAARAHRVMLANEGVYIASESSFRRVLRAQG
jgi:hypothetical protein